MTNVERAIIAGKVSERIRDGLMAFGVSGSGNSERDQNMLARLEENSELGAVCKNIKKKHVFIALHANPDEEETGKVAARILFIKDKATDEELIAFLTE